jgi:hypothetical protein
MSLWNGELTPDHSGLKDFTKIILSNVYQFANADTAGIMEKAVEI